MKKLVLLPFAILALFCFCMPAFAQADFDYLATDNLILTYRTTSSTGPSSDSIGHGDNDPVGSVRINTRTNTIKIGKRVLTYFADDIRRVEYDDCILLTGEAYLTKNGGKAPFQIKEFPDNTLYISITWPDTFEAKFIECALNFKKELKSPKRSKK